jgi:hypothetical protein
LSSFLYVFVLPEPKLKRTATQRDALRVYSNTNFFRKLDKPAEFGLEKLASIVNYLLLASAAILGFMTKSLMELRAERAKSEPSYGGQLRRFHYLLFLHAGVACFFSLAWGVLAYLSLPDIAVVEQLAITGVLSRCVQAQIAGLLLAVIFLLLALGGVVRDLLPGGVVHAHDIPTLDRPDPGGHGGRRQHKRR